VAKVDSQGDREIMTEPLPTLAVVGGTGNLGAALAGRWAKAGYPVIIGSRDANRAAETAAALAEASGGQVTGQANAQAAAAGDLVVVCVPFANHRAILEDIGPMVRGKIVVDATVPLVPPKVARVQLPPEGSAAQIAQSILGQEVQVVSAFHHLAANKLAGDKAVACDVLVFGDSKAARGRVVKLAEALGVRGIHGGALANSAAAEALTSVLIFINKAHKVDGAGILITGDLMPLEDT
jgi:8-hydroxy-5-deazaflavin:NADPH oxidoreductase